MVVWRKKGKEDQATDETLGRRRWLLSHFLPSHTRVT